MEIPVDSLRAFGRPARAWPLSVLVLAATLLGPALVHATRVDPDLAAYREVVTRYRSADGGGAVDTIASWDWRRLVAIPDRLSRLSERERRLGDWDATQIVAAGLLHLEVLVRHPELGIGLHLWVLRRHLTSLRALAPGAPLTADLHLALALHLHRELRLEDLQQVFAEAGETFASHGELLLAQGTLHEALASRRLEAARRAGLAPGAKGSLAKAERFLRQALVVAPRLTEARLRLARVVLLRGRPDEALTLLATVLRESSDPDERYLADLFRGRAHDASDRTGAAETAYAAADGGHRCGQAAAVGLSHLAYRDGRLDVAREILERRLRQPAGCPDPWSSYDRGQARRVPGLIATLQDTVRR